MCLLSLIGSEFPISSALWKVGDTRQRSSLGFVYFALVRCKQWPHRAAFSVPSTSAVDAAASRSVFLQACRGGWRKRKKKLINSIHTVIIMTFILILDVMTAIYAACTAVVLIRMETALWMNFLLEKVYLIHFTVSI